MIRFQSCTYDIQCEGKDVAILTLRDPTEYFVLALETSTGNMEKHLSGLKHSENIQHLANKGFRTDYVQALRDMSPQAYPAFRQKLLDPTWKFEYHQALCAHKDILKKAKRYKKAMKEGRYVDCMDLSPMHMDSLNKTNNFIEKICPPLPMVMLHEATGENKICNSHDLLFEMTRQCFQHAEALSDETRNRMTAQKMQLYDGLVAALCNIDTGMPRDADPASWSMQSRQTVYNLLF
ncbi:hypothetical protein GUITHDRAFT_121631 [Guillardia theta CCMP2712]|uniref:Uncharacterized protein n=1 Tax=Guillardia theta (strain CCMP2712) TaxID=905079 RepID=L1I7I5_GUITC|nr:hypothetical protein GUITHDRAFT_121631 [Guillardia theta CCMP2712]EKX32208.1 hypothetical protein GUITHDRAFT_121631 [Guillardia theta CCMP2712]|eukprot:XP_005819188.1 hypothetical protein GUITHDRAFT_121631 [Guillardia theta CCMP2712]